jgi:oxygen-independent coproporphyrinogen-3 oxidase
MEEDRLIKIPGEKIIVMEKGKDFVRNICMAFDALFWRR